MRIMCWGIRKQCSWLFAFFMLLVVSGASANVKTAWVESANGRVQFQLDDASRYAVRLSSDVRGVFYDSSKHKLDSGDYVALFQVSYANPGKPEGLCGAADEIWLYVYKADGLLLSERARVLVSSCLDSVSMASQNTGAVEQDTDFSSVQWSATGFSIEWFQKLGVEGRPLRFTHYVLHDQIFVPLEVPE